jgi:hypothetical protein
VKASDQRYNGATCSLVSDRFLVHQIRLFIMAPASSWISLPSSWKLQDVQATLNVIITVLSTLGVTAFAKCCWQSAAQHAVDQQTLPLSSLLSINTVGEAFDIMLLLRSKMLRWRHWKIFAQFTVVLCLSTASVLSGPLARYSTNRSHEVTLAKVPGMLTARAHDSILNAPVVWNETFNSLDEAGFPYDQLLDYLPDPSLPWVYNSKEWNSSWSISCRHTYQTSIDLYDTGNCTSTYDELPGLNEVIPLTEYGPSIDVWWGGFYTGDINKDTLLGLGGKKYSDVDTTTNITYGMTLTLASVHLHNFGRQTNSSSFCSWASGPISTASYTKIECDLRRNLRDPYYMHIAFPDCATPELVARAMVEYYTARFIQESISDSTITVLTPTDLVRFLQTWMITKDTQYREPVTRALSVRVPVVQLSSAFVAIAVLAALLILAASLVYINSKAHNRHILAQTPQSKLDWIQAFLQLSAASSSSSLSSSSYRLPTKDRRRADFEAATYHVREHRTWDPAQPHGAADYTHLASSGTMARKTASVLSADPPPPLGPPSHADKAPMLSVDLVENDDYFSQTSRETGL